MHGRKIKLVDTTGSILGSAQMDDSTSAVFLQQSGYVDNSHLETTSGLLQAQFGQTTIYHCHKYFLILGV